MPTYHHLAARALAALSAAALLSACDNAVGARNDDGTFYGAPVTVGAGTARTYVTLSHGAPSELGVAIRETGLDGLPQPAPGTMPDMGHPDMTEYLLPLPPQAAATPYRTVEVDWNPHGHEPAGVYDQPHFDFHFYTISLAERNAIDPADAGFDQKAANHPPAEMLPQGYVPIPGAVPRMGVHWVDPASPELHGQPFTHTFIYGSWDGRVTFTEPMVTRAYLLTRPAFVAAMPVPQKVAAPGSYPATQRIYWSADTREYRVALSDFAARQ